MKRSFAIIQAFSLHKKVHRDGDHLLCDVSAEIVVRGDRMQQSFDMLRDFSSENTLLQFTELL